MTRHAMGYTCAVLAAVALLTATGLQLGMWLHQRRHRKLWERLHAGPQVAEQRGHYKRWW